ncbi:MAG: M15 family metallopeptidase [bacterium]
MKRVSWSLGILILLFFALPALCKTAPAAPPGFKQLLAPPFISDRFIVDLRYNTDDNFLHRNVYGPSGVNRCWLDPIAAQRLMNLVPVLAKRHLKLLLWDCWRPLAVQKEMWKILPDPRYVADPAKGSNHNRGMAVDCTLTDEEGDPLPMPTAFDDFSEKASPNSPCTPGEKKRCENRDQLIKLMKQAGFEVFPTEWWHYQPAGMDLGLYPVQ